MKLTVGDLRLPHKEFLQLLITLKQDSNNSPIPTNQSEEPFTGTSHPSTPLTDYPYTYHAMINNQLINPWHLFKKDHISIQFNEEPSWSMTK